MEIPLPKAGHWQKLQFNKKVKIEKLSNKYKGKETVTLDGRDIDTENESSLSIINRLQREIEADTSLPLTVPQSLYNPHKLVALAKESLSKGKNYTRYKGVINCERDNLAIRVSPKNVGRSLRIFNAVIKLLYARGHTIEIKNGETRAIVNGIDIELSLREKLKRIIIETGYSWNNSEFQANGILCFKVDDYYGSEFLDGKKLVEEQLSRILAKIEHVSIVRLEWKRQAEIQHMKYEQERLEREAIEAKRQKEISDFKKLIDSATKWKESQVLHNYINEVERLAIQSNTITKELIDWINWSRERANLHNPLYKQ
jgi:hypothetical protein